MKKLKVAHFGIAHDHSGVTMECARKYPDVYEIVGVCEPDEAMRVKYGSDPAYVGIPWITEEELLSREDIDAVFCEGHELRSVSDAQKCIDRGLHVPLDKPGGIDLLAFERLLRSAEAKGLTLQMGYMYRWNPAFQYVWKKVKSGELGTITGIDSAFSITHISEKRKWLKQFPGGMMFYIGCHLIDMIMLLMQTPDNPFGTPAAIVPFNRSSDWENDGSMDSSFAVLDYPHGACTVRTNATEVNGYATRRLRVCGTEGTLEIQPLECPTLLTEVTREEAANRRAENTARNIFPGYLAGRYDDMMLEFAACARGEMKNPISWQYELELQRVLLEACK